MKSLLIWALVLPISVAASSGSNLKESTKSESLKVGSLSQPFQLQCWQQGVKIIDEKGMSASVMDAKLLASSVHMQQGQVDISLIEMGEVFCLAKSSQGIKLQSIVEK